MADAEEVKQSARNEELGNKLLELIATRQVDAAKELLISIENEAKDNKDVDIDTILGHL